MYVFLVDVYGYSIDIPIIWRKGAVEIYFWNNCAFVFCDEGEKRHFESCNPFHK